MARMIAVDGCGIVEGFRLTGSHTIRKGTAVAMQRLQGNVASVLVSGVEMPIEEAVGSLDNVELAVLASAVDAAIRESATTQG